MNGYGKSIPIRNLKKFLKDFDWRSEVHDQHVSKSSYFLTDSVNNSLSDLVSVNVQRLENFKNLIIGQLNINSIWNKFETTSDIASKLVFSIYQNHHRIHLFQTHNSKLTVIKFLDVIATGTVGSFFDTQMKKYHVKF